MKEIERATDKFIQEIKDTGEYRQYIFQRDRISCQPDLKMRLDEFRIKNFNLQNDSDEEEDLFDKIDAFEKEYEGLRSDPLVSDFLEAELTFCRMIQNINVKIADAMEFDLE